MRIRKPTVLIGFILKYLLMILLFLLLTIPILLSVYKAEKKAIIEQNKQEIHANTLQFKQSIDNLSSINNLIENYSYFNDIKYFSGEHTPSELFYKLRKSSELLRQLTYADPLVKDALIYFNKNQYVLSRSATYTSHSQVNSYYIPLEKDAAKTLDDIMWTNQQGVFLPAQTFAIADTRHKDYTPYVTASKTNLHRVVCFYDNKAIADLFRISHLPDNSFFYIADFQGNIIVNANFNNQTHTKYYEETIHEERDFSIFSEPIHNTNYYVSIGIPNTFILTKMYPIIKLITIYLIAIICFGIALAIALAFKTYAPIKRLVSFSKKTTSYSLDKQSDEYTYLHAVVENSDNANKTLCNEIEKMKGSLKSHFIIRCLFGQLYSLEDYQSMKALFPQLSQGYRVSIAVVRNIGNEIDDESKKIADTLLYSELKRALPCSIEQISEGKTVVILTHDPQYLDVFVHTIQTINANLLHLYGLYCDAGISLIADTPEKMSAALEQAFMALPTSIGLGGCAAHYEENDQVLPTTLTIEKLQRIYMLTATGNKEALLHEFDQIAELMKDNPSFLRKQSFYSLRYLLSMLIFHKNLTETEDDLPNYNDTDSNSALFLKLTNAFEYVCDKINMMSNSNSLDLFHELCDYISFNFSSPDLCIQSLSDHFHIHEKQIYSIFKASSALSPSEYILKIRMDYAISSIKETTDTIAAISQKCGFNSTNTFHKAFKRYFGVSPLRYREQN